MKECSRCHLERSADAFYDSNPWTCKDCVRARAGIRYKEKREECLAQSKKWTEENPARSREIKQAYRERNRETEREYFRFRRACKPELTYEIQNKYRESHPWVYTAAAQKRRAAKLNATPPWANFEIIGLFYEFAALLSEVTGEEYEVDHIVPLQGEFVSGLHVETNLRVMLKHDNRVKSNKFEQGESNG